MISWIYLFKGFEAVIDSHAVFLLSLDMLKWQALTFSSNDEIANMQLFPFQN